jgi:hypothetical protein
MDLELWTQVSMAISDVEQRWPSRGRDTHPISRIVRMHLWSTLHDRPTCWGCVAKNWTMRTRPPSLPDQSTMSRRMKREDFEEFLTRVGQRLNGDSAASKACETSKLHLRIVDGKALELPNHSTDPDARWGRGVSRTSLGYKLHFLCSAVEKPMPDAFVVTPLNRCEKQMAARMIKRVRGGGYLLADAHLDASWLFDRCRVHGHQLVCPRAKPHTALGHHYQSPDRVRAIEMLEPPANVNRFGPSLYRHRSIVERRFSAAVCFGGGIGNSLPPWVRGIRRVRRWITAKLLINAARIRNNRGVAA